MLLSLSGLLALNHQGSERTDPTLPVTLGHMGRSISDTFHQPSNAATTLTEMSEPDQNEQDKPAAPHKSLATFEDSAGDKVMLGRLPLTKNESGGADA